MILNITEELPPLTKEEVSQVFINTLDLISGFSILFLQCSPAEANQLIPRVRQELPEKNIKVLDLIEPIDNLYRLVESRTDRDFIDILFIRGLGKSLKDDIKPGYKGIGDYYNLNTVPPILSHLNQQRENFRDHFGNICFVFVLPKFAIRYFVRRAPDFYDWNSGVFEITDHIGLSEDRENVESYDHTINNKHDDYDDWFDSGNSLYDLGRYEEAVKSYDQAIMMDFDNYKAWSNKGNSLYNLGQYEEAIESYDQAITINRGAHKSWCNRGASLHKLGRYDEEIKSYNQAISLNPNHHEALYNLGNCMGSLGRYEEAIEAYNKAININPDKYQAWHNQGFAYYKLGKYPESVSCYDQATNIKSDQYNSWYDKGMAYFVTSNYSATVKNWQEAFKYISNPEVPRYHDIEELIQEFIEALIPRFTQPPIQQTLLIPLLTIYKEANVITELGAALVNTLHLIIAPTISDHTANQWLSLWRTSSLGNEPAMELPLRLMSTAIEYKKDPSKRQRLWLNLPSEERPILDKALKLLD
jgi:tetratricopeptide (TPR) repeat protein